MRSMIVLLAGGFLAACASPQQQAAYKAEQDEQARATAELIVQACERSGYPRGTAEHVQCSMQLYQNMQAANAAASTGNRGVDPWASAAAVFMYGQALGQSAIAPVSPVAPNLNCTTWNDAYGRYATTNCQ